MIVKVVTMIKILEKNDVIIDHQFFAKSDHLYNGEMSYLEIASLKNICHKNLR